MDTATNDNNQVNHTPGLKFSGTALIGPILVIALFAFEIFNFDTTRYALLNLLGDVNFWGLRWATILAIAFCSIDFAGLARLFTPEQGRDEPNAVWYLMGAWLLGATLNALMTWWAVSLTLLAHDFGNEVLSRAQLLQVVPIFVAALVWLTRILFIGAFSVAGEYIFVLDGRRTGDVSQPARSRQRPLRQPVSPGLELVRNTETADPRSNRQPQNIPDNRQRIRRRPPMPPTAPQAPVGMQARGRRR